VLTHSCVILWCCLCGSQWTVDFVSALSKGIFC
jgi:hypothetical protein